MSGEAGLRYKLNKKLKIASGGSKNFKDGKKKVQSTLNDDRNVGKGKFKPITFDRKKKRIYGEQDADGEVTYNDNAKAPNRKGFSKEGQKRVKDDFDIGKRNEKSPRSKWASSRIRDATSESKRFDRKNKRIYGEQDADGEVTYNDNAKAPYRKAFSKEGQKRAKDDFDIGKRNEKSPRSKWASSRIRDATSESKRFDRKNKRIYGEQDADGEVTYNDNAKAPYRKAFSEEGQKRVKDDFDIGKSNEKSPCSKWASSRMKDVTSESKRFDRKKERINAVQDMGGEVTHYDNAKAPNRKALSKKGQKQVKDDFDIGQSNDKSSRSIWDSSGIVDATSESKHSSRKLKNTVESAHVSNRIKAKDVDEMDGEGTGFLKKRTKSKSDSVVRHGPCPKKSQDVSPSNSANKTVQQKRGLHDDSEVLDDQPKKRKRVIRIDPYDISNKRLDDGIVIYESTKEKKKDLEKNTEMSKNAQFRAIQPSPSILSFVEDNLLGRRRLIELRRAGYNTELSAPLDNIPSSTSSERERIEENIFRSKLTFFAAAKVSSSFPDPDLPEIAFAGRSNVGKSSLLNALTRQWGVARTSDKPGLTQSINFFKLGSKVCLVDLPGYGFAYAKEEVKDAWEELVKEYVSTRVGLKRVCLLIDTKWGMKPRDRELIDLMERYQTKYQIVLTKTDMIFPIDVARRAMQIEESLKKNKSEVQPLMMVSSKSGAGIQSLRTVLSKIARFAKV